MIMDVKMPLLFLNCKTLILSWVLMGYTLTTERCRTNGVRI